MARNFKELQEKMSPERRAAAAEPALNVMTLRQLRKDQRWSQMQLAREMYISQGDVSRIENRSDIKFSSLDSFVNALGGTLEIHAIFPEKTVLIMMGTEED